MILDQPDIDKPRKKRMTWFELALVSIIIIATIAARVYQVIDAYDVMDISMIILSLGYLFAYDRIDKPVVSNPRTGWISILYGAAFCAATFSYCIFDMLNEYRLRVTGIVLVAFALAMFIDFASSSRRRMVATSHTFIRMAIFTCLYLFRNLTYVLF